jgi:hypothetical protein
MHAVSRSVPLPSIAMMPEFLCCTLASYSVSFIISIDKSVCATMQDRFAWKNLTTAISMHGTKVAWNMAVRAAILSPSTFRYPLFPYYAAFLGCAMPLSVHRAHQSLNLPRYLTLHLSTTRNLSYRSIRFLSLAGMHVQATQTKHAKPR